MKKRLQRELDEYRKPEVRSGLFGRSSKRGAQTQVFRSLVQVNFYPRDRR